MRRTGAQVVESLGKVWVVVRRLAVTNYNMGISRVVVRSLYAAGGQAFAQGVLVFNRVFVVVVPTIHRPNSMYNKGITL